MHFSTLTSTLTTGSRDLDKCPLRLTPNCFAFLWVCTFLPSVENKPVNIGIVGIIPGKVLHSLFLPETHLFGCFLMKK